MATASRKQLVPRALWMATTTPLDLMLIGKPGSGKSATGNSMLQQRDKFKIIHNTTSQEKYPQYRLTRYDNRDIQVVECPGIIDTDIATSDGIENVVLATMNSVLINPQGYHALLIVVKYSQPFLFEDLDSLRILKIIFGENVIKSHGVIVMCQGDSFNPLKNDTDYITFETYCEQAAGPFKKLLEECNHRIVLFDNETKNDVTKTQQLNNLLKTIDQLDTNRMKYTTEWFGNAVYLTESINKKKEKLIEHVKILRVINNIKMVSNSKNILKDLHKLRIPLEKLNKISSNKKIIQKVFDVQRLIAQMINLLENNKNANCEEVLKEIQIEIKILNEHFRVIKHETDVGYFHICFHLIEIEDCNYSDEIVDNVKSELHYHSKLSVKDDNFDETAYEEESQPKGDEYEESLSKDSLKNVSPVLSAKTSPASNNSKIVANRVELATGSKRKDDSTPKGKSNEKTIRKVQQKTPTRPLKFPIGPFQYPKK